eukprot:Clim_evm16s164 gene=Clim_evmTU16s164
MSSDSEFYDAVSSPNSGHTSESNTDVTQTDSTPFKKSLHISEIYLDFEEQMTMDAKGLSAALDAALRRERSMSPIEEAEVDIIGDVDALVNPLATLVDYDSDSCTDSDDEDDEDVYGSPDLPQPKPEELSPLLVKIQKFPQYRRRKYRSLSPSVCDPGSRSSSVIGRLNRTQSPAFLCPRSPVAPLFAKERLGDNRLRSFSMTATNFVYPTPEQFNSLARDLNSTNDRSSSWKKTPAINTPGSDITQALEHLTLRTEGKRNVETVLDFSDDDTDDIQLESLPLKASSIVHTDRSVTTVALHTTDSTPFVSKESTSVASKQAVMEPQSAGKSDELLPTFSDSEEERTETKARTKQLTVGATCKPEVMQTNEGLPTFSDSEGEAETEEKAVLVERDQTPTPVRQSLLLVSSDDESSDDDDLVMKQPVVSKVVKKEVPATKAAPKTSGKQKRTMIILDSSEEDDTPNKKDKENAQPNNVHSSVTACANRPMNKVASDLHSDLERMTLSPVRDSEKGTVVEEKEIIKTMEKKPALEPATPKVEPFTPAASTRKTGTKRRGLYSAAKGARTPFGLNTVSNQAICLENPTAEVFGKNKPTMIKFDDDLLDEEQPFVAQWNTIKDVEGQEFVRMREVQTKDVFEIVDREVFQGKLGAAGVQCTWTNKLNTTAGRTTMSRTASVHRATIELATKILDRTKRLKSTLCHEMCHAAAWIIDHTAKPPHGPRFKYWARMTERYFPELDITTCHDYAINFKFQWKCTNDMCGQVIGRHSNTLGDDSHCGRCGSAFRALPRVAADGTPIKPRPLNAYQRFIKLQTPRVKKAYPEATPAERLKILGTMYRNQKGIEPIFTEEDVIDLCD